MRVLIGFIASALLVSQAHAQTLPGLVDVWHTLESPELEVIGNSAIPFTEKGGRDAWSRSPLPGMISGEVLVRDSTEIGGFRPLGSTNVLMGERGLEGGRIADENGRFTLGPIDPGQHTIQFRPIGAEPLSAILDVREDTKTSIRVVYTEHTHWSEAMSPEAFAEWIGAGSPVDSLGPWVELLAYRLDMGRFAEYARTPMSRKFHGIPAIDGPFSAPSEALVLATEILATHRGYTTKAPVLLGRIWGPDVGLSLVGERGQLDCLVDLDSHLVYMAGTRPPLFKKIDIRRQDWKSLCRVALAGRRGESTDE